MLRDPPPKQHALEMVTLEELVPKDHLLRQIDRHIEATRHLYCDNNGRPSPINVGSSSSEQVLTDFSASVPGLLFILHQRECA